MTTETITFKSLNLIDPLLNALHAEGYDIPTPIQRQAIPHVLEGKDLLGVAQTGTGKTAAFALPILQRLTATPVARGSRRPIRTLVLTPTRELAAQISESFERYGKNLGQRIAVIFGGVGQGNQVKALRDGVDILIATPGRLLDLIDQRHVDLTTLEIFVLDEADRMLDMGFIHDVKRVIKIIPRKRQSLFFSATMPPDIQRLASEILSTPVKVEVTPVATTAEKIDQSVYFVDTANKRGLLEHLMKDAAITRALVFTRTKHGADKVAKFLNAAQVSAEAIHGNKSQNNRIRALNNFKNGVTRILVATDIAARGIDIDGVSHVINYDLPNIPESYVHRIGRTARAGAEGDSISFCDREEREFLRDIERLIRMPVRVVSDHPYPPGTPAPARAPLSGSDSGRSHGRQSHGGARSSGRDGGRSGGRDGSRDGGGGGHRAPSNRNAPRADSRGPRHSAARPAGEGAPRDSARGPQRPDSRTSTAGRSAQSAGQPRSSERRQGRPEGRGPQSGSTGAARSDNRSTNRPSGGGEKSRPSSSTNTSRDTPAAAGAGEKSKSWWKRLVRS